MFTGIVTDVGRVRSVRQTNRDRRYEVETAYDTATIDLGASISHAGCCLTVVEKGPGWFAVEVSEETLSKTTLGDWGEGTRVNLERAAKLGDEMGGHVVSGHVDGVGEVLSIEPEGGSHRYRIRAPRPLHRYIAAKGSIAVEGVSLTVNEVEDDVFGLNIIPHTWDVTSLGALKPGSRVNLEIDMLARYLARWQETAS
ncbi:riboflavin synthase [Caulobacter ginsengisoli]|uniref:Riboflavin synthase n=1 Tax=Caulobacter ginsengisoli TaxID=400775 RepID=A0ABU0IMI6_9CAUL|nr:riboflavin synthase [Caulobacter ginsengisoli]MDQ0463224.1 riboflavin synthase [Caulobacter ginsengisoli]